MKKYICRVCNYKTDRYSDYSRHNKTKKHIKLCKSIDEIQQEIEPDDTQVEESNTLVCEFCNKEISNSRNIKRHYNTCRDKIKYDVEQEKNKIIDDLIRKNKLQEEKIKDNMKIKDEFNELEQEYIDLLKKLAAKGVDNCTTIINNCTKNTANMYYIINNFNDAINYEDIMASPLTDDEIKNIRADPTIGCVDLIKGRCIDNTDLNKRSLHCTDESRDKFLLRHNNSWMIDKKASAILEKAFNKVDEIMFENYSYKNITDTDKYVKNMKNLFDMKTKNRKAIIDDIKRETLIKNNINQITQ